MQALEKVLIVEDDEGLNDLLSEEVRDIGYKVQSSRSMEDGRQIVSEWVPDAVISDVRLPGQNGLALLSYCQNLEMAPAFLVITAFGSVPQAVEALKAGADNFLTKPLDLDHLRISLMRALESRRLKKEINRYQELLGQEHFHGMAGQSSSMRALFAQIRQLAAAGGPVLIIGESGSGKELVARAIHNESMPAGSPFVAVNCAGVPEGLLESEFFGHAAGAFTGASTSRKGLFSEAEGGTLLLDEIAEMPLLLQTKLLRVLEDGKVRPVGSNEEVNTSVRVIAATHRDLEQEVKKGKFREDLFYRLETFMLKVPPLRERDDDLELLVGRFISSFSSQLNKEVKGISEPAMKKLKTYSFSGNVRELKNAIERAVTLCRNDEIELSDLPERIRRKSDRLPEVYREEGAAEGLFNGHVVPLAEMERRYIDHVMKVTKGNKRRTAALLGIGRRTLYRKLEMEDN